MVDLKAIRKAKGYYTQESLADAVCVHRSTIGMIEAGVNKPSVELAKKLGKVLEIDWTLFFSD